MGTKRQAQKSVEAVAKKCGMHYVSNRWLGGMLTNFRTVRSRLQRLEQLEAMAEDGTLEKESKKRKLKNIVFTGKQPKSRIPDFLQASDAALVVLRRKEIFKTVIPTKMLESMAMAKPIILGVEGEAKRIIEEAGAGVPVTPENPSELATAIRKLKEDPALCVSLGEKGREYVKRLYDRDKLAADYSSILEQVQGRKRGQPVTKIKS